MKPSPHVTPCSSIRTLGRISALANEPLDLPSSPAAQRNRDPIAAVLREVLPGQGLVLELASGTGEHSAYFAPLFPDLEWQPTDRDEAAVRAIRSWREHVASQNIREPLLIDVSASRWPIDRADAILCINMVHISPWAATEGLMRGAGAVLGSGAPLILYGPYHRNGVTTAASNLAFDASLRARNPDWGLRSLEAVAELAEANGLTLERIVEMPANNLTIVFRRTA